MEAESDVERQQRHERRIARLNELLHQGQKEECDLRVEQIAQQSLEIPFSPTAPDGRGCALGKASQDLR